MFVLTGIDVVEQSAQEGLQRREFLQGETIEKLTDNGAKGDDKLGNQRAPGSSWLDHDSPAIDGTGAPGDQAFPLEPVEESSDPGVVGPQPGSKLTGAGFGGSAGV